MKQTFTLLALFALLPLTSFAETTLPPDLMYNGKPIDALCISDPNSDSTAKGAINLESCGLAGNNDLKMAGQDAELEKKGYTGYTFASTDQPADAPTGYSYYKAFGNMGDKVIVYSVSSGGGSGEFSKLLLVKRSGDSIKIEALASGDRCNGGVYDVKRTDANGKNASLTYNVNITPADYLALANDNPHKVKAYDELDACAACCAGSAVFTAPLSGNTVKAKLSYVDIGEKQDDNGSSSLKYQACFDNLLNDYRKKGMTHLSMQQLKEFTKAFNKTCVKK